LDVLVLFVIEHCGVRVETTALRSMNTLGQLALPKDFGEPSSLVCSCTAKSCADFDDCLQCIEEETEYEHYGVQE
jgi:hypothetical protein